MKRGSGLLALLFAFFAMLLINEQTSYAPTSTEIIRTENPDGQEAIILDQVVQDYYFGQQDQTGSYKIAQFGKADFPKHPTRYALHQEEAVVLLNVRTNKTFEQVEGLLSQIKIEGNVRYSTTIQELSKDSYELRINFHHIKNRFTVNFGNLPPITLRKMAPLQVDVVPQSGNPEALLLTGSYDTPSVLLVTKRQTHAIFRFSQPMVRSQQEPLPGIEGSWMDDKTYRISLNKAGEDPINLRKLLAVNGNYLPASFENLYIRKVSEREWIDSATGKAAGFSSYDSFYDQLLYSPNRDKYVGVVNLRGWQQDRFDNTFGFVLEQPGKAPTMIAGMFASDVLRYDAPIQWIDNDHLLFASRYALYLYDCRTNSKKELFQGQFDKTKGSLHEVTYDPYRKKLYLLVSFHVDHKDKDFYYVDKWVVDGLDASSVEKNYFSNVFLAYKYQLQPLPIYARKDAVYWTKADTENKQVYTVRQERGGQEFTADGRIAFVDAHGNTILVRDRDSEGKSIGERYYWWEKGKKPRLIPEKTGVIDTFRTTLLAKDKAVYYRFDPELNNWVEMRLEGNEIFVPAQETTGFYRRKKAAP